MITLTLLVFGQLANPQPTGDGKQIYFERYAGIYRVIETGEVQPFAESAQSPQVTWGGTQVSFLQSENAILIGDRNLLTPANRLRMSLNGRWLLIHPALAEEAFLFDLESNSFRAVPSGALDVAMDGTVLLQSGSFWRDGQTTRPPLGNIEPGPSLHLSQNGRILFYRSREISGLGKFTELRWNAHDLETNQSRVVLTPATLGTVPVEFPRLLGSSADGSMALFLTATEEGAPGKPILSNRQRIPAPDGELITGGSISGDGQLVFLITESNRLLRYNLFDQQFTLLYALQ